MGPRRRFRTGPGAPDGTAGTIDDGWRRYLGHNLSFGELNMRRLLLVAVSAALLAPLPALAQGDVSRSIANGGIFAKGWMGEVDPTTHGQTIKDARFEETATGFHVTTGPATTYWNPADVARGDYTVKATFTEPKFMNRNDHPHPYGIFIAGNDLGTDHQSLLYCEAYGDGRFIVRGFGPRAFQLNGREGAANPAVHKAAGQDQPVTQDIAMSVRGDKVECAINGTVVASYPKSSLITDGRLTSTDGVYGIRFAHNTEGIVKGLTVTKP
jgi:hypothetical protein